MIVPHFLQILRQLQLQIDVFTHQLVDLFIQLLVFLQQLRHFGLASLPIELILAQYVDLNHQLIEFALVTFDFLFQFRHFLTEIVTTQQRQHLTREHRLVLERGRDRFDRQIARLQPAFSLEELLLQLHDLALPLLDLTILLLDYSAHLQHLELQVCYHFLVELLVGIRLRLQGFLLTLEIRSKTGSEVRRGRTGGKAFFDGFVVDFQIACSGCRRRNVLFIASASLSQHAPLLLVETTLVDFLIEGDLLGRNEADALPQRAFGRPLQDSLAVGRPWSRGSMGGDGLRIVEKGTEG